MLHKDLAGARQVWLYEVEEQQDIEARQRAEELSFLTADSYEGVVDFHALRHTFITNLANSGVHPSVAQRLARHSTIDLTLGRYTHTSLESMTEAINRLPEFEQQENQEVKTGTMDLSIVPLKKITSTKGDLKSHKSLSKSEKSANGGDIEKCTPPKRP